jgi:uncharacterized membrane protein YfcA
MFDTTALIIIAGSLIASIFNAAFSAGGAMIILAITSTVLPVQAIVPMHSTLLIGSTLTRVMFFWEHIDWKIVIPFLIGAILGAFIGARIYVELPETFIALAIGVVMLIAIWLPSVSWRPRLRHPWAIVGFIHSLLSTLFAYGAVLHAVTGRGHAGRLPEWHEFVQDRGLREFRLRLLAVLSCHRGGCDGEFDRYCDRQDDRR